MDSHRPTLLRHYFPQILITETDWVILKLRSSDEGYILFFMHRSIRVLAKIESLEALQNLEEIIEASDGIMVARGDLGVEIPLEQIPAVQEEITRVCRELNKPVIIASQLLESMVEYPTPTRAEVQVTCAFDYFQFWTCLK